MVEAPHRTKVRTLLARRNGEPGEPSFPTGTEAWSSLFHELGLWPSTPMEDDWVILYDRFWARRDSLGEQHLRSEAQDLWRSAEASGEALPADGIYRLFA